MTTWASNITARYWSFARLTDALYYSGVEDNMSRSRPCALRIADRVTVGVDHVDPVLKYFEVGERGLVWGLFQVSEVYVHLVDLKGLIFL